MRFGILLIFLVLVLVLFLIYRHYKKEEFNSINIGDEIFYPQESFYDESYNILDTDTVTKVEYYEDGENVKFIHTKKGEKYNFLDYMRGNFILSE
jgi:hypothetical protein